MLETKGQLAQKDLIQHTERIDAELEKNSEFRINWPRGELGSPPADSEQFMLIEHIAGQLEAVQKQMENMMNNGVNIKRLQEDVKILREDVEKLKDSNRSIIYQNGNGKTTMKKIITTLFLLLFASSVFAQKLYTGGEKYEKDNVVALTLTLNGKMIEWVYKENISQCLKSKRIASREVGGERVVFFL